MGFAGSNRRGNRGRPAGRGGTGADAGNGNHSAGRATATPGDDTLRFTFPSDYNEGFVVQKRILEDVERHGFSSGSTFAIRIALEEALINAIKHGNRLNRRKKVHVEARVTPQRVEIMVEDEGPGFDRCSVPDPTALENLTKCSGRGILLIEYYMNSVTWDRGGRRLRMVRQNGPDEVPARG